MKLPDKIIPLRARWGHLAEEVYSREPGGPKPDAYIDFCIEGVQDELATQLPLTGVEFVATRDRRYKTASFRIGKPAVDPAWAEWMSPVVGVNKYLLLHARRRLARLHDEGYRYFHFQFIEK